MNHVNDLKTAALLIINNLPDGHITDLEHDWLIADLGLPAGTSKPLNDLWYDYLIQEGATPAHVNDMMEEWLILSGYTGSVADMMADMWADGPISTNFLALAPANDGTFSVDPTKGSGTATFSRTGEVAHVRDHENVYRLVQANEARIQGARRVENLFTYSSDLTHANWLVVGSLGKEGIVSGVGPNGEDATEISFTSNGLDEIYQGLTPTSGVETTLVCYIAAVSGTTSVRLDIGTQTTAINLTTTFKKLSITATGANKNIGIRNNVAADSGNIYVIYMQAEIVAGASNTAPSEYIPTTTAAVAKYFTTTNGNSVAANIVTEEAGLPLHPTVRKEGVNVLARYATRADTTAYVVGDNIIPAAGSGPAGGNGYWYQVTAITTGTSGGSPPTFPETIGDTVVDGGITIKNMGHYRLAGYLGEPAATNSILQSRQFDTSWAVSGTPTLTQDQTGIDGVANIAWSIEDNDGASSELVQQGVTIPNDLNIHCAAAYILKDSNTTRFPAIRLALTGGTTQQIITQINTQTGAITNDTAVGTITSSIEDHGLWWRVVITVANNSTGNVTATSYLYAARASSFGSASAAATGTTVFDQAQLELNTSVPSSPIITTTVAVTRNADISYPQYDLAGNFIETDGTVLLTWIPSYTEAEETGANLGIVDVASGAVSVVYRSGTSIRSYDGTTIALKPPAGGWGRNEHLIIAVRFNSATSKLQVIVNGAAGTEVAFDGAFTLGSVIKLLTGQSAPSNISDIRIYKKDLGQAACEAATAYD